MAARLEELIQAHCFCCVNQLVLLLTSCTYMAKAERYVSKEGHLQPRYYSKARSPSKELWNGGVINGKLAYRWNSLSIIAVVDDQQKGRHLLAGNLRRLRSVMVTIAPLQCSWGPTFIGWKGNETTWSLPLPAPSPQATTVVFQICDVSYGILKLLKRSLSVSSHSLAQSSSTNERCRRGEIKSGFNLCIMSRLWSKQTSDMFV